MKIIRFKILLELKNFYMKDLYLNYNIIDKIKMNQILIHNAMNETIEYIYVLIRETPGAHHVKAGNALPDWVPPDDNK